MRKDIDFIGDVHGKASRLEALLYRLGYTLRSGAWWHPTRIAVFVGDLVDRGPEQFKTLDIVRRMRDAGSALCIMGNHEHSAIGWVTPSPHDANEFCRPHNRPNQLMHAALLREAALQPELYKEFVLWMKTLPVALEVSGVRVAHACWDEQHVPLIQEHTAPDGSLTETGLMLSLTKGNAMYKACEVVMKGPEAKLPNGMSYHDHLGKERRETRIAWWAESRQLRDVALPIPGLELGQLPDVLLDEAQYPKVSDSHLHFVGHYWMRGAPAVLKGNLACVDYSGTPSMPLTAYRWDGEDELLSSRFVQI